MKKDNALVDWLGQEGADILKKYCGVIHIQDIPQVWHDLAKSKTSYRTTKLQAAEPTHLREV